MQQYKVCLHLQNALHVSGGISTHHQEFVSLYTVSGIIGTVTANCCERHVAFTAGSSTVDTVDTVL